MAVRLSKGLPAGFGKSTNHEDSSLPGQTTGAGQQYSRCFQNRWRKVFSRGKNPSLPHGGFLWGGWIRNLKGSSYSAMVLMHPFLVAVDKTF
mmetsp:Transcript_27113/g.42412  ORF Transcript_27113/g.42412 Transcript_27113/m.42412 type:complete len:92 (-) Transcript_27113:578-853(-)